MGERLTEWFLERRLGAVALGRPLADVFALLGDPARQFKAGESSVFYPGLTVFVGVDSQRVAGFSVEPQEDAQSLPFEDLEDFRSMSEKEAESLYGAEWTRPGWTSKTQLYRRRPSDVGVVRQAITFEEGRVDTVAVLALDIFFPHKKRSALVPTEAKRANTPREQLWRLRSADEEPQLPTGERLLDWLLEARLGPLPLGSPLDDVIALLGEPQSFSAPTVDPPILKYPAVEVFVSADRQRLAGFHIEPGDVEEAVPYDDLALWQTMTVEQAERLIGDGWTRSAMNTDRAAIVDLSRRVPSAVGSVRQSIHFKDDEVAAVGLLADSLLVPQLEGSSP